VSLADTDTPNKKQTSSVKLKIMVDDIISFSLGDPLRSGLLRIARRSVVVGERAMLVSGRNARRAEETLAIIRRLAAAAARANARHHFHASTKAIRTCAFTPGVRRRITILVYY